MINVILQHSPRLSVCFFHCLVTKCHDGNLEFVISCLNSQTFEDNLYNIPLAGKGSVITGTQGIITYLKAHRAAKDEPLSKIQSSIDEQQIKLTELKNRGMDKSQETISDTRAAHDELEPELKQAKAKARQLSSSAKSLFS